MPNTTDARTVPGALIDVTADGGPEDFASVPFFRFVLDLGESSEAAGYAAGFISASVVEAIDDLFGAEQLATGALPTIPTGLREALANLRQKLVDLY